MYSLVDLILIADRSLKRDDVQHVLSVTTDVLKTNLQEGKDVLWVDLCTFTWKAKAKTKKQAAEFAANPELSVTENLRIEPVEGLEELAATGGLLARKKKKKEE